LSAQAVFVSANSGNWNSSGTWTLVSGSDANGRPDSDDDVTIQSGHTITVSRDEACNNFTFDNGSISYSGNKTVLVGGDVVVSATSTINGYSENQVFEVAGFLTVNSGVTLNVSANKFDITGATTVNGTLAISGYGAKPRDFGDLTINSGGTMTVGGQDLYTFNGNVTNNGTFTANDQTEFRFASTGGTISGANPMSMYKVVFDSPGSYTNKGNFIVRNDLTGTGSFTNGLGGNLELQNSGPFTVSTFSASVTGNTITYTGYGNPTAFSGDYYDLILNKSSGSLSFGSSLSILNNLTIDSGILQINNVTLTVGNNVNLNMGELSPDNVSAILNIGGDLNVSDGEYDHNNGDVNITGVFNVTGGNVFLNGISSTVDAGSISLQNVALTLSQGALTSTSTFDLAAGTSLTANGAAISASGSFNMNGGSANFTGGSLSAGALSVAAGLEIFINAVNLNVTGQATLNGTLTFNSSTGTKSVGSILVNDTGIWNVTQPLNITVAGNITNNGVFTGDPGYGTSLYTLTSTSGAISGSNNLSIRDILINSPASYTNGSTNLAVGGSLDGTGDFINGAGATLKYQGDNSTGSNFTIANFTASAIGNTVEFGHQSASQQWRATSSANNDYYNVTLNFTSTGDFQRLQLVNNVRVNGTLNIIAGDPVMNTYTLELGTDANVTGGSATEYIRQNSTGFIRKYYASTGAALYLPIGDNTNFSPINNFTLNSGTLGANPYIDFGVTDANHPDRNTDNTAAGGDDDGTVAVAYISRYWTTAGNDISNPAYEAELQYIDADVTGTESDMIAALRRPITVGMSTFDDWLVAGTVNATTNRVLINKGDNFGNMYAMDNTMARLPIMLMSFEAKRVNRKVELRWETASEYNNEFFTIERSMDGQMFESILDIKGAGNSSSTLEYTAVDLDEIVGRVYYRLKQTDFNGTFDYSEIISLNLLSVAEGKPLIKLFPNAVQAGGELNIVIQNRNGSSTYQLDMISLNGVSVLRRSFKIDQNAILNLPLDLKPGYYLIKISNSILSKTERIIVR
jgi:hypothetical protein